MKLGSKFLSSLRVKTQLLKRLQCVIVVDGATYSLKDGVQGNEGSLKDHTEVFVLFLRGVQLVLRYSVLKEIDLNEACSCLERCLGQCVLGWLFGWWLAVLLRCSTSPSIASYHFKKPIPLHY